MSYKILIVEDNKDDLAALTNILKKEKYEIVSAMDGISGLAILEKENPELVILDILLPDIDGFEICSRIRKIEQYANLPVLFYTAVHTTDEKLIGLQMGASDFLVKNSDERELLVRIKNLLNMKDTVEKFVKLSVLDGLTNVYNKLYFQYRMDDECKRAQRYKRDFSCAVMDIDNFKNINTLLGHVRADNVLKNFADILRNNIRSADILCRGKIDDFYLLLPETGLDDAYLAVERIRQFILTSDVSQEEKAPSVTISCGVTAFNDTVYNSKVMLTQADNALRKAKSDGRNQTRVYGK